MPDRSVKMSKCHPLIWIIASAAAVFVSLFAVAHGEEPSVVRLERQGDRWQLVRNGEPYHIRGAAGPHSLDLLAQYGGNSTRTWGVGDDTLKRLDEAHRNGISVALGIWIEHEQKGFDFHDEEQVSEQVEKVLSAVRQFKNHPAVLLWGIGNEMEGYQAGDSPAVWSHIEQLCQLVKLEDPNHPVMSVIAEIGGNRIEAIHGLCPSLDIIGITQPASDPGPELGHNLIVNLGRPLVNDQESDIVFSHLPGTGAESGLGCHLPVEELVRFFHHDDQRSWFTSALMPAAEIVRALLPYIPDAPGEQVGNEKVIQVRFMFPKGKHNMLTVIQVADHLR